MSHQEIISLVIAYTLVGAFIFTVVITCLSLVGVIELKDKKQQNKLFYIVIVEVVVGCVGFFFNWLPLNPTKVAQQIEQQGVARASEVFKAVSDNNIKQVKRFLDKGFDVNNVIDIHQGRPLHLAAERCHIEMTTLLLSQGANTKIENEFGDTPIEISRSRCGIDSDVTQTIQNE